MRINMPPQAVVSERSGGATVCLKQSIPLVCNFLVAALVRFLCREFRGFGGHPDVLPLPTSTIDLSIEGRVCYTVQHEDTESD